MDLEATDRRTVGVEEEFLLVDATGVPRPLGERVTTLPSSGSRHPEGIDHELQQEQAETGTRPQLELAALHDDLRARRRTLADAAIGNGVRIAALATSPLPVSPTPTYDERYLQMMVDYGATAREQLTCGCHVHVGIGSAAEGIAAINAIQPWLSVILAISANSPFWQGLDTGYASYRRMVWDRWPGAGPTAPFEGPAGYDATVAALMAANVLMDKGMVYFDARLSAHYPTVEVRVADVGLTPESSLVIAALCRALVDSAARSEGAWPAARVELLRGAAWRAARSGIGGELVDPVAGRSVPAQTRLQQLLDQVRESLRRHGDLELVESALADLLRTGTGADVQRAAHAARGSLRDVVADAVRRAVPGAYSMLPES